MNNFQISLLLAISGYLLDLAQALHAASRWCNRRVRKLLNHAKAQAL